MKKCLIFFIAFLVICYPFLVYFGLHYFSIRYVGLVLALIFFLRFVLLRPTTSAFFKGLLILTTIFGIGVSLAGIVTNQPLMMKLYPFLMSFFLFSVFSYSLWQPPTIVERLARLKEPNLSDAAVRYTKNVTALWCGFFAMNGLIALWTIFFASTKVWAFYNGFLSYILMGCLFAGEYIFRRWIKNR